MVRLKDYPAPLIQDNGVLHSSSPTGYPETDMPETIDTLMCPFCGKRSLVAKPGKTSCPVCKAKFEIDDRLECIFVDSENLKLPTEGVVCPLCGLIQNDDVRTCLYCGVDINSNLQ
jgi:hypothetical protein